MDNHIKAAADVTGLFVVGGTLLDYLPKIAAGFAIAWYIYRFWVAVRNNHKIGD